MGGSFGGNQLAYITLATRSIEDVVFSFPTTALERHTRRLMK